MPKRAVPLLLFFVASCGGSGATPTETAGAMTMRFVIAPASLASVSAPFDLAPRIRLLDAAFAPVKDAAILAELHTGVEGATLIGATSTTNAAGEAVFSDLAIVGNIGVYRLRFRAAGAADMMSEVVTLVPPSVLAAFRVSGISGDPPLLHIRSITGTAGGPIARPDTIRFAPDGAAGLTWHPSGMRLILHQARVYGHRNAFGEVLYEIDADARIRRLITEDNGLQGETWPRYSADGQWIFFSGRPGHQDGQIWRVRSDGRGAEPLTAPLEQWGQLETQPSPSPDGTRVVYASNRGVTLGMGLSILDLDTRQVTNLPLHGITPRWSPTGEWIAYTLDQGRPSTVNLVRPDGTNHRELTYQGALFYSNHLEWSPDGKYLMVRGGSGLEIIDIARDAFLQLPGSALWHYPAWIN